MYFIVYSLKTELDFFQLNCRFMFTNVFVTSIDLFGTSYWRSFQTSRNRTHQKRIIFYYKFIVVNIRLQHNRKQTQCVFKEYLYFQKQSKVTNTYAQKKIQKKCFFSFFFYQIIIKIFLKNCSNFRELPEIHSIPAYSQIKKSIKQIYLVFFGI